MMQKVLFLILFIGLFASCEEVIDVDLNDSEPKLVIEASINLLEDKTSSATVKLTYSAPFFDDMVPVVANAQVQITDDSGLIYDFNYTENGIYEGDLLPVFGKSYTLEIVLEGETYSATEQLYAVPPIEYVEQSNSGGFSGEDIEVKVFFTDPAGDENYYFFEGLSEVGDGRDAFSDEFFDGNTIFGYYSEEDLAAGDEIVFNLYGVNKQFYNFMFLLLQQGMDGGGPFETQPATVRGNIVNRTNPDNFPFGYFRISELSSLEYTIE